MNEQDEAIVPLELFSKQVKKLIKASNSGGVQKATEKLTDAEIDCAYVYLCRGMKGPFSKK